MVRKDSLTIALASTARGYYGGEEQTRLLARGLRERGHDCFILARRGEALATRLAGEGFAVVEFGGRGWSFASFRAIRQALRQRRPDVLHFNDSHALTGVGVAALGLGIQARVASRRVVFPIHWGAPYRLLCERVLCVSRNVMDICHHAGIPADRLRLVPDGSDPARIHSGNRQRGRSALGIGDHQFLLLMVATLAEHKGHRYLLEAFAQIRDRFPEMRLALAGAGDLAEPLRQQAKDLNIDSRVHFLGYRNDVPDLLAACDLFVLPSLYEGLCTSLIDAMLAGRAIVTTSAGGIADLVGSPTDAQPRAWIVPPGNSQELAATLAEALSSSIERDVRQRRARSFAEKHFTSTAMIESTLSVYREVLGHGSGALPAAA